MAGECSRFDAERKLFTWAGAGGPSVFCSCAPGIMFGFFGLPDFPAGPSVDFPGFSCKQGRYHAGVQPDWRRIDCSRSSSVRLRPPAFSCCAKTAREFPAGAATGARAFHAAPTLKFRRFPQRRAATVELPAASPRRWSVAAPPHSTPGAKPDSRGSPHLNRSPFPPEPAGETTNSPQSPHRAIASTPNTDYCNRQGNRGAPLCAHCSCGVWRRMRSAACEHVAYRSECCRRSCWHRRC